MSGHSSYVQTFFQLNFEHNGSSPNIHESTQFQILRLPQQGRKERLLIDEETRFYKIIPENCKEFFNNIKYFYESNFLSGVDKFLIEQMYDILKMTELQLERKYPNKGLSYISSNNRDTFYLVINPRYVSTDTQNQITEKERELRNILNNKQHYDTICGYDKNEEGNFVGGTLRIQLRGIQGVYNPNAAKKFKVTFQIDDKIYTAKPIQSHGFYMTFDTRVYEFKINNPDAMLNITIQEQKDSGTETTTKEIPLFSSNYKKRLEQNETFYFSFPHVQYRDKQLSVNIEFICSAISYLNRKIDDLYKESIRFLPNDSKERFLVL